MRPENVEERHCIAGKRSFGALAGENAAQINSDPRHRPAVSRGCRTMYTQVAPHDGQRSW